jgi:acetyl-CoA acetyltransferase
MNVYVIGAGMHPACMREDRLRLEEMAYHTSRRALEQAGVSRAQLDSVTLGACDELDGRPISSMLMTAPAGGFNTDEIKVTESSLTALCLAYARFMAGESQLGLVVSWCKSSKTDVEGVMRLRGDPFFTRPLGIGGVLSDGLFAQAVSREFDISEDEVASRVVDAYVHASRNDRGVQHPIPSVDELRSTNHDALPVRTGYRAPLTDGAVALVLASDQFLSSNPDVKPLARIAGAGWATDSYRFDKERLGSLRSAHAAWNDALRRAGLQSAADLDAVEIEAPTGYHDAAFARAFGLEASACVSPSGGSFAQNPLFCTGLINAAEAVLQVAGRAGAVQLPRVRRSAAHGCHGYAQQGNAVVIFERVGDDA